MHLSDYLPADHIITDLKGKRKIEIIDELLNLMRDLHLIKDFETALNDVMTREGHLSTGLENGLAIPHAKTTEVEKLLMVFGLSRSGVEFETLDGKPAELIFLVLSPHDTSGPHIQALAMISRNLKNANIRKQLKEARTAQEMSEIFASFS